MSVASSNRAKSVRKRNERQERLETQANEAHMDIAKEEIIELAVTDQDRSIGQ